MLEPSIQTCGALGTAGEAFNFSNASVSGVSPVTNATRSFTFAG